MNSGLGLIAIPYTIGTLVTWIHTQFWSMEN